MAVQYANIFKTLNSMLDAKLRRQASSEKNALEMLKLEQSKAEFAEELDIAKDKLKLQKDEFDLTKEAKDRELFNTTKDSLSKLAVTNMETAGLEFYTNYIQPLMDTGGYTKMDGDTPTLSGYSSRKGTSDLSEYLMDNYFITNNDGSKVFLKDVKDGELWSTELARKYLSLHIAGGQNLLTSRQIVEDIGLAFGLDAEQLNQQFPEFKKLSMNQEIYDRMGEETFQTEFGDFEFGDKLAKQNQPVTTGMYEDSPITLSEKPSTKDYGLSDDFHQGIQEDMQKQINDANLEALNRFETNLLSGNIKDDYYNSFDNELSWVVKDYITEEGNTDAFGWMEMLDNNDPSTDYSNPRYGDYNYMSNKYQSNIDALIKRRVAINKNLNDEKTQHSTITKQRTTNMDLGLPFMSDEMYNFRTEELQKLESISNLEIDALNQAIEQQQKRQKAAYIAGGGYGAQKPQAQGKYGYIYNQNREY